MKYSALIQFCILAIILLAIIYTYNEHQEKTAKANILLRDYILIDEIAKYHVLKNSQALDLLMLSIQSEYQLDSVRFGLFSAKEYMDSLNGELHIKSSVGEGTIISLIFAVV
jgi:hypothetical protein